jgi:hypothetical protein
VIPTLLFRGDGERIDLDNPTDLAVMRRNLAGQERSGEPKF